MTFTDARLVAEKQAIVGVVNAIGLAADRHDWAACRTCFADVVRADWSSLTGGPPETIAADELIARWRAFLPTFVTTQHLVGSHGVRIEGDCAHCRSQLVATHVSAAHEPPWRLGATYEHELQRTERGWIVTAMACRVLWQTGSPPA